MRETALIKIRTEGRLIGSIAVVDSSYPTLPYPYMLLYKLLSVRPRTLVPGPTVYELSPNTFGGP